MADVSLGFVNNVTKASHLTSSRRHMVIDNWLDKVCIIQYGFTVTDGYYSTPSKTEWVRGACAKSRRLEIHRNVFFSRLK